MRRCDALRTQWAGSCPLWVVLVISFLPVLGAISEPLRAPQETVLSRFLRYVKIDTQSAEDAKQVPSTAKQFDLARLLESELKRLGAQDVTVTGHALVYAKVPGNLPDNLRVPVLGLIAHMDTSPAASGANVQPIVHTNYQGGDIVLPNDPSQVIRTAQNPGLTNLIGDDIITADGTTLLGSDDKAGIAAIMTMLDALNQNSNVKHGSLAIAFTPDEEAGDGIETLDLQAFGAQFAYTVDGGPLGEICDETWNAWSANVSFKGKNTHAGTAKGIMINSIHAAGHFLTLFPKDMLPETTEGTAGFIHPYAATMTEDYSEVRVLLRDFRVSGLDAQKTILSNMVEETRARFPSVGIKLTVQESYRNMKEVLKSYPELMEFAFEAARLAGVSPYSEPHRGGTDGGTLTFKGLPTPNLFTGGHNFHGKLEFNSRKGLERTTETLVHLTEVFAEKGGSLRKH